MSENLRLVTDFAQLKAGDLVVVRPCLNCGHEHRGILTKLVEMTSLQRGPVTAWEVEPKVSHWPGTRAGIGDHAVNERVVYLVDTGLEESQQQTKSKTKPRALADAKERR